MASVRANILTTSGTNKLSKKLRSVIETARVMADRDLVKLLREAREDIKAGNTVPLSSLRK